MSLTTETSGVLLMRYWPIVLLIGMVVGAAYVGKRDIGANAGDIKENQLNIEELENRVIVESKTTSLALQELKLKQEAAIKAQNTTARNQGLKLDQIIRSLKID